MKYVIIFTVLVVFICGWTLQVTAEIPQVINYQGRLTDSVGAPLDTVISMTFTIFSDTLNSSSDLWHETHPAVTVKNGLFNILLGSVTPIPNSVFDGTIRGLGLQIGGGPVSDTLVPIISIAYAYKAGYADTASYAFAVPGGSSNGWIDDGTVVRLQTSTDSVGIGTATPGYPLQIEGKAISGVNSNAVGQYSTIAGGAYDTTYENQGSIGGGKHNIVNYNGTIAGGAENNVIGQSGTIGGVW